MNLRRRIIKQKPIEEEVISAEPTLEPQYYKGGQKRDVVCGLFHSKLGFVREINTISLSVEHTPTHYIGHTCNFPSSMSGQFRTYGVLPLTVAERYDSFTIRIQQNDGRICQVNNVYIAEPHVSTDYHGSDNVIYEFTARDVEMLEC